MVLPFISAGLGILSSVGGFMGQQSQTAATNRQRLLQWQMQQEDYLTKGFDAYSKYNMKKAQYQSQLTYNKEAFGNTVFAGDRKSEQLGRQALYAGEQARTKQAEALGTVAASGMQGVTAGRMRGAVMASFGRQQQLAAENLISKRQDIMINRDTAYRKMIKANQDAYADVYIPPKTGPAPAAPVMQPGPNPLGLIAGIGDSIVGGIQMHNDLKPPGQ